MTGAHGRRKPRSKTLGLDEQQQYVDRTPDKAGTMLNFVAIATKFNMVTQFDTHDTSHS